MGYFILGCIWYGPEEEYDDAGNDEPDLYRVGECIVWVREITLLYS
jgi:hypothetical protein